MTAKLVISGLSAVGLAFCTSAFSNVKDISGWTAQDSSQSACLNEKISRLPEGYKTYAAADLSISGPFAKVMEARCAEESKKADAFVQKSGYRLGVN